jgi:hypothetical protein
MDIYGYIWICCIYIDMNIIQKSISIFNNFVLIMEDENVFYHHNTFQ